MHNTKRSSQSIKLLYFFPLKFIGLLTHQESIIISHVDLCVDFESMKRSTFITCILIGLVDAFWNKAAQIIPSSLNPLNLLFFNRCMEDLGCFYTGAPFFHPLNRPISLPPVNDPTPKFMLFTPTHPNSTYLLEISKESLKNSSFDPQLESKFLIHGFLSSLGDDDVRFQTKDALLESGKYNVIIVDWTDYNGPPYEQAVANTRVIGAVVAKLIKFLRKETGISPKSVHLIGHSLGAHTAGYAGERVPNIGRITGLDPAGPCFQNSPAEVRLDPTDALFVDIIHTDGADIILRGLGMNEPLGHMDFFPNGGSLQLGCVRTSQSDSAAGRAINFTAAWRLNGCDHDRANRYFHESIQSKCKFDSVKCDDYEDYEKGKCNKSNSISAYMGFHAQMKTELDNPAKFYLRTNAEAPFCAK
ncbi:pancreatic triacylglycerol lipase [Trichonephila inaurata madagascariensis]|uniref:Pancreatic triacylglycerol lipase n=1 Tax=Trichonephila inaurata madagascariensis TaxID=2747483 RepID=A0A8X6YI95_9ARAC|nr:pancreatic triacylglycerol lipase [Trichonephila inaurata madagascariensis]